MKKILQSCNCSHRIVIFVSLLCLFMCGVVFGVLVSQIGQVKQLLEQQEDVALPQNLIQVDVRNCAKIEKILLEQLGPQYSSNAQEHRYNSITYSKIFKSGCPENAGAFKKMALDELDVAHVLEESSQYNIDAIKLEAEVYKNLDMVDNVQTIITDNMGNLSESDIAEIQGVLSND